MQQAGKPRLKGLSVGTAVATGGVSILDMARDINRLLDGSIRVTATTHSRPDPDHAAAAAIAGTGCATQIPHDEQDVTVTCTGAEGVIHEGPASLTAEDLRPDSATQGPSRPGLSLPKISHGRSGGCETLRGLPKAQGSSRPPQA